MLAGLMSVPLAITGSLTFGGDWETAAGWGLVVGFSILGELRVTTTTTPKMPSPISTPNEKARIRSMSVSHGNVLSTRLSVIRGVGVDYT